MKSRLKVVLLVMAIVLVVALLYIALSHVGKMSKTMFSSNQVNCKTFRLTAAEAVEKLIPFKPIQMNATCVAGLDTPDKITYILSAGTINFVQNPLNSLESIGWRRADDGTQNEVFTKNETVEAKDVEYKLNVRQVSTSPDVREVTFTSSINAFTDFAKASEVPADITMTPEDRAAYAVPKLTTLTYVPDSYIASEPKRVSFTESQISLNSMVGQNSKKAATLTIVVRLSNSKDADNCGGVVSASKGQATCELLATTADGTPIYRPKPAAGSNRMYYDTYISYGQYTIIFLNSYRAPAAQPQLSDEQIVKTVEATIAAIQ